MTCATTKRKPKRTSFDKLDAEAKERARDQVRRWREEDWQPDFSDAIQCAHILGLHGRGSRGAIEIHYRGFYSQGDGASFEGRYAYAADAREKIREHATDKTLHAIADGFHAWAKPPRTSFLGGQITLCEGAWETAGDEVIPGAAISVSGREVHSGAMRVDLDGWEDWDDDSQPPKDSYWGADNAFEREKELLAIMRRFADWIYRQLQDEYEYDTSDEAVDEECNDREWTEEGKLI